MAHTERRDMPQKIRKLTAREETLLATMIFEQHMAGDLKSLTDPTQVDDEKDRKDYQALIEEFGDLIEDYCNTSRPYDALTKDFRDFASEDQERPHTMSDRESWY